MTLNKKNKFNKSQYKVTHQGPGHNAAGRTPVYFAKTAADAHQWVVKNGDAGHNYQIESPQGHVHSTLKTIGGKWQRAPCARWSSTLAENNCVPH
jgi:hypothetical protein